MMAADISPALMAEVKAYLRIATTDEDAVIAGSIGSAISLCESFTGCILLIRSIEEIRPARREWTRMLATPVRAVTQVEGLPAEGAAFALPVGGYAIDIDGAGDGWIRVTQPGAAGRVRVTITAGMATDWDGLPEPLRHGIVRLTAHFFTYRDDAGSPGVPSAVAALWQPWRRMRLG